MSEKILAALQAALVYGFEVSPITVASMGVDAAAIGAASAACETLFEIPSI